MITKKQVEHVALLGRLEISEEEKEMFAEQLSDILKYAEELQKLDTDNIQPTAHAVPLKNVFREDKVNESLSNEDALANAPAREEGSFKVPKVL